MKPQCDCGAPIVAALPDPVGPDAESESVTLGNGGASDVSLDGWTLMDRSGNVFALSGVVPASATLSITVDEDFALNQSGDNIRLLSAAGELVHEVSYTNLQVVRGEFITF